MARRKTSVEKLERRPVDTVAVPPASVMNSKARGKAEDVLHRLVEEFGRLVARRHGERKGYGILELLAGTLIMALILLLLCRIASR